MKGEAVKHTFERGPPKDHLNKFCLIWFHGFLGEDLNVIFFYQIITNLHNLHKLAKTKIKP